MFCQYCGKQLPDNARFCDACGGPVNSQQLPPTVFKDMPHQEPSQSSPSYTIPLDPEKAQQYTIPLGDQTQQGQYTPPVNSGCQDAAPVNSQVPPPVTSGFQGTVPQPSAPTQPQPGKKRVRKLPILLGVIAVVLVIVLVAVFAGGDSQEKDTEETSAASLQERYPENRARFDENSFLFTADEYGTLFRDTLQQNGAPSTLLNSDEPSPYFHKTTWQTDNGTEVTISMREDPDTGKITGIFGGFDFNGDDNEQAFLICLCAIDAAHGSIDDDDWGVFMKKIEELVDDDNGIVSYGLDELTVSLVLSDTKDHFTFNLLSKSAAAAREKIEDGTGSAATETQAPASGSVVDPDAALRDFPMGQMHFSGTSFLFDAREGMGLFQACMEGIDLPLVVADVTDMGEGKYNYSLFTTSGADVGWMIVQEDTATGKVLEMSLNYTYQENEDEDLYGMQAALCMIEIAHGALTDAQWDSISETEPMAVEEDYTMYRFRFDGMKAMLTVREDRLYLGISIEG